MSYEPHERLWERLIEQLSRLGSTLELDAARTRVTFADAEGTTRSVDILMSHDEWDDMVSVLFADFAPAAERVRAAILGLRDDERFLIYENYDLVPSATADLSVDPELEALTELARQRHGGIGRWVVTDGDGNVIDEFRRGTD